MEIGGVEMRLEGTGARQKLVIEGRPFGLSLDVTAADLARWPRIAITSR